MQLQPTIARNLEDPQHLNRFFRKITIRRAKQLAIRKNKAGFAKRLISLYLQRRRTKYGAHQWRLQNARQTQDFPSRKKIMAHKALYPVLPAMPRIAHARPDNRLKIKSQAILCAPGHVMHMKTQRPKKFPRSL